LFTQIIESKTIKLVNPHLPALWLCVGWKVRRHLTQSLTIRKKSREGFGIKEKYIYKA